MFGRFGVWRRDDQWTTDPALAAELEELGFGALWVGGSWSSDLGGARRLLEVTSSIMVATGIVNMWTADATEVSRSFHRLGTDRFVLGVGAGHRELNPRYDKPYETLVSYLDTLDVPAGRVVLAALGPRMLALAAARTLGAHPYLTTVGHTARARALLGGKLLAPEVTVVVDEDPLRARATAREFVGQHFQFPNYTRNLRRLGYTDADFAGGGSDRLIDDVVAWGAPERIAARLGEHLDAGADHLALQSLNGHYAELARTLFGQATRSA